MMKKYNILTICLSLIFIVSCLVSAGSYSLISEPLTLDTYHPRSLSTKGYIDLVKEYNIPPEATINYIKLTDYGLFSAAGEHSPIQMYLYDEKGHRIRLIEDKPNYQFKGKSASQKFYLRFKVNRMQFKGNLLRVNRPHLSINVVE